MAAFEACMLLALLCLVIPAQSTIDLECEEPVWDESLGPNPFEELRGNVILVAMLHGYCGYCVHQAARLYDLKNRLEREGFQDIEMLIINGGETRSRVNIDNLINASAIPVLQDRRDHHMYRHVFRAFKDDFIVYDRCGHRAFFIPHPYSNLDYSVTGRILRGVHSGLQNCYCNLDYRRNQNMDNTMMGDDPMASDPGTSNSINSDAAVLGEYLLNCPPDDAMCRHFQRIINRPRYASNMQRLGRLSRRPTRREDGGGFLERSRGVSRNGGIFEDNNELRSLPRRRGIIEQRRHRFSGSRRWRGRP